MLPAPSLSSTVSAVCSGPEVSNRCLPYQTAVNPAIVISTTADMTKFRNTTNWLRERFDRRGGGVPACGRRASLAVLGTIGLEAAPGWSVPP